MEEDFPQKHSLPKGIIWGVVVLALIFAASFAVFLRGKMEQAASSAVNDLSRLEQGINDLKDFNSDAAKNNFGSVGGDSGVIGGDILKKLGSFFGGAGDLVSALGGVAKEGTTIAEEVGFFGNNLPDLLLDQKGDEIISRLKNIQSSLGAISGQSDKLSLGATKLNSLAPSDFDFYIPLKLDLARYKSFLDSFLGWLTSDSPRHLLVLFQNPSEIRPAGGFLGSYADVTVDNANIIGVDIRDVNDATKSFDAKIIPPKPLQAEITGWKAADANWFFDFSRSASQVIKFMEMSKMYASTSQSTGASSTATVFDGALAVSPRVIGDILKITGPVAVSSTRAVLDEDNFLLELQKIVQQGQASHATYPKVVLKELAANVLEKVRALDAFKKQEFFGLVYNWLQTKDIMLYFKDAELEGFLDYYGFSGKSHELMPDFEGDYLAIVDANLGGGKSDIFVKQDVELQSQISADGMVSDHLVISREHQGAKGKYWWYKTPNLDYLQLFLSPSSELVNFKGGVEKNITPPINYTKNGYVADDYVAALESSTEKVFNYPAVSVHPESGKKVFATWSKIAVGEKVRIVFDYKSRLYLAPADGTKYQFVFDKQAGTSRHYSFTISAPVGFIFRETNSPAYTYEASDPAPVGGFTSSTTNGVPGRLILNLTLKKI